MLAQLGLPPPLVAAVVAPKAKHHKLAEEGTYAELVGEMGY